MEKSKNNIEIKVGRFTILSDGLSLWIMEEYEGKDKNDKPKMQKRKVAGYAYSIDTLVHQFVSHKHKAAEAKTISSFAAFGSRGVVFAGSPPMVFTSPRAA